MNEIKKSGDSSAANGGWVKRKFYGRPRTRLFTLLSLFWIAVSAPAVFIAFSDTRRWVQATSLSEKLRAVAFEQWIGLLLIVLHLLFVTLAIRFHFTEEPREEVFLEGNPDRDPHKLY
jgi:hypothetical protein